MTNGDSATVAALRARARANIDTLPETTYPVARPPMARCKNCQAPIWWRKNPSGKFQPMNYDLVTAAATTAPHHATCAARARR